MTKRRTALTFAALALSLLPAGCQQKMARQPAYRPLQPSESGNSSARPLVPGTVARGHLQADAHFYTGRRGPDAESVQAAAVVGAGFGDPFAPLALAATDVRHVDTFPFPVTEEVLHRGRERFNIYCSVCHDRVGTGSGLIVQRGFTRPPALVTRVENGQVLPPDYSRGLGYRGIKLRLDEVPPGYVFDVITNGYGAMPDYSSQVPPRDRWAIVAYVRALQFSQDADPARLPEEDRAKLQTGGPP
jgi:mono/diheme cytochrome c family protein